MTKRFWVVREGAWVYFFKNLAPEDFLRLLDGAECLVGNSSVGIRESAFLGVPVVNIGNRQAGRDRGKNVQDVGYDEGEIRKAVGALLDHGRFESSALYGDGQAGRRIADLLAELELTIKKQITY